MLVPAFIALYVVAALMMFVGYRDLSAFLSAHAAITDVLAIEAYKGVVRRNMQMALVSMMLLVSGFFVGLAVLWSFGMRGLVLVIGTNLVTWTLGQILRRLEVRARSLPAVTPELAEMHASVSAAWMRRALPDF